MNFAVNVVKELNVSRECAKRLYRNGKAYLTLIYNDIVIFLEGIGYILCGNRAVKLFVRSCCILENNLDVFKFCRNILCILAFNVDFVLLGCLLVFSLVYTLCIRRDSKLFGKEKV